MATIELEISEDGVVRTMYDDALQDYVVEMGAQITKVDRASNVEWERPYPNRDAGWVVRAADYPDLAVRVDKQGNYLVEWGGRGCLLAIFKTREEAIQTERKLFWDLIPTRSK